MFSFRSTVMAVAAVWAITANADYYVDPDSVPEGTRESWCTNEKQTCPLICQQTEPGTTLVNECDPATLTYGCLCGDHKRPNVSEYSLTLPYFVCQEWGNQCVTNCKGDNACSSSCRQDNPCGAQNPEKVNTTETASATGAAATASKTDEDETTIYTGSPGSGDEGDAQGSKSGGDSPGAGAALEIGRAYGLAIVLGGLFAGFALL